MKNITEMFISEAENAVESQLEALHNTIELLVKNDMEDTIHTLFSLANTALKPNDLIITKFKQYAKEFKIEL